MADTSVRVNVRGLAELSRAVRKIDGDLPNELKAAFLRIAQKVVDVAQQRMPHISGRAQRSIKAKGRPRGASIAFGGTAAPHMPWLDFGGSVGRGHRPGLAWSGAIKREWMGVPVGEGRYIYPAISQQRDETRRAADAAIAAVAKRAGFDQRGSSG